MSSHKPSDNLPITTPPKKTWKNLGVRAVTGLALAIICVVPLYFGGWIWAALVSIFGGRMAYEWVRMSDPKPNLAAYVIPIIGLIVGVIYTCLLYTSPSPRDGLLSRMPSSA